MSDCEWLSDRMPVVALGRAEWTPDEIRHLNECGSCRRGVGADPGGEPAGGTKPASPSIPPSIAAAVVGAWTRPKGRAARRRAWSFGGLAAAAAVAAALWTGGLKSGPSKTTPGTEVAGRRSRSRCRSLKVWSRPSWTRCCRRWTSRPSMGPSVTTRLWAT